MMDQAQYSHQFAVGLYIDENLETNLIGGLYISSAYHLQDAIIVAQNRHSYFQEIKYSKISTLNIGFYKHIIDICMNFEWQYYIMQFDKINIFSYGDYIGRLTKEIGNKQLCVILDHIPNTKTITIEKLIEQHHRNVCYAMRENSKSNILIQVCDLILGLSTRDPMMIDSELKKELIYYFKEKINHKVIHLDNSYSKTKNAGYPIH